MLEIRRISKTFNPGTPNEVRALTDVSLTLPSGLIPDRHRHQRLGQIDAAERRGRHLHRRHGNHIDCRVRRLRAGRSIAAQSLLAACFRTPSKAPRPPCPSPKISSWLPAAAKPRGLGIAVNRRVRSELRDRIRPLNMGLEDRLDNPIGSLSGGQRQALTLLMASWLKPELLLLDEHTAALDPKTADQVIRLTHDIIHARPPDHIDGHALHAPGRKSRRSHRDDAQGQCSA